MTATTREIVDKLPDEAPFENVIVEALGLAGVSTASDLAEMVGVEVDEAFEKALASLLEHGLVVRHATQDAPVYVVPQLSVSVLAGRRLADAPAAGLENMDADLKDDLETLEDLLGPPSWRYEAPTLEQFVQKAEEMPSNDASAWVALIERGEEALVLGSDLRSAPAQVRRLSVLTQYWPEEARTALNAPLRIWAGLTASTETDFSQGRIVTLPSDTRAVAVAGPGAGKTFTIQKRIVRLLESGLSPASISVIAYSRIAVAELLGRVPVIDGEVVDIRTIDSIAGLFATHATQDAGETDYDGTVQQAIALIARDDRIPRRWLDSRRHLIVDEAQDVVGPRREMLKTIIGALPQDCGVTVFGDPAQAIYDYRARESGYEGPAAMDSVLTTSDFERYELGGNHRTSRSTLRHLAREGRRIIVFDTASGHTALADMRDLVNETSDGPPPMPAEARPLAALALFRSHAAAARHAARMGEIGVRVRLSDTDIQLAPAWVGRAMKLLQGRSPAAISELVQSDPTMPAMTDLAEAFAVALVDGRYDAGRMTEAVRNGRGPVSEPPIGQVASTIHAAKGKEAQDVELHLPAPRYGLSDAEASEEARVLYVGATRARRRLYVTHETGMMAVRDQRHWRAAGNGVQVQLKPSDATGMRVLSHPDGPVRAPLLRWRREGGWGLFADVDNEEVELARFSETFDQEIASICAGVRAAPFVPVARGHFWVDWHTIAREDALEVVPVIDGFVWINFKQQGNL